MHILRDYRRLRNKRRTLIFLRILVGMRGTRGTPRRGTSVDLSSMSDKQFREGILCSCVLLLLARTGSRSPPALKPTACLHVFSTWQNSASGVTRTWPYWQPSWACLR